MRGFVSPFELQNAEQSEVVTPEEAGEATLVSCQLPPAGRKAVKSNL